MIIANKKTFYWGAALLASFALMFWAMLTPLFPGEGDQKITALEFADKVFNQLSKGSSWFIPQARQKLDKLGDTPVDLAVSLKNSELANLAQELLTQADAKSVLADSKLRFTGNLKEILVAATEDSALLYQNQGAELSQRYNIGDARAVARAWWQLLSPCVKELQKQGKNSEAALVDEVIRRAIEPAHNFYGIKAENVSDNILMLSAFIFFYIIYTLWYGFAIYEIFDGLGLMATETKAAEELEEEREEGVNI